MRIALASLKGGVGKTTLAVFLAEIAAERDGKALLVDADPQQSAVQWDQEAREEGESLRASVQPLPTRDLARRLDALADSYRFVVVDTPPGDLAIVTAATRVADLVVIPCQPTVMDVARVGEMIELAKRTNTPAVVVLSRARARTRSRSDARQALAAGFPLLDAEVPQRELLTTAYGGRPPLAALALFEPVFDELQAHAPPGGRRHAPSGGRRRG